VCYPIELGLFIDINPRDNYLQNNMVNIIDGSAFQMCQTTSAPKNYKTQPTKKWNWRSLCSDISHRESFSSM